MNLPKVDNVEVSGKRVFVRTDIDVPLGQTTADGLRSTAIDDETRLEAVWPTIKLLLDKGAGVIVAGHIGRPGGVVREELSTKVVAQWFLGKSKKTEVKSKNDGNDNTEIVPITLVGDLEAYLVTDRLIILENLRFNPGEESNDLEFARQLAALGEIYVNESFASAEREHASVVGVPAILPHYAGLRLAKEVETLVSAVKNPQKPLLTIIGGAKLETKIPAIREMAKVSDHVLVGGKLLSELGIGGLSKNVCLTQLTRDTFDVTLDSVDKYLDLIKNAKTIIWNGPLGMVEDFTYQVGTRRIAELVAANTRAFKILGGGDTVDFVSKLGLADKFDWVSTGGGSMLELLAGEKLPGVEVLLL